MDRRIKYLIGIDTETCNAISLPDGGCDLKDSIVYDVGWEVTDKRANVYLERSFIVAEVFLGMADIMKSAYYAKKNPQYLEDINAGRRIVKPFGEIVRIFRQDCRDWNIQAIFAHNARFDWNVLNNTQRFLTKSRYRYFFPYGIEIWDTMKMAQSTIAKQKGYIAFCDMHNYKTKKGQPRVTAEILTRYLLGDNAFNESHTGLEDVRIEAKILAHCFKQHKSMNKQVFSDREFYPFPEILIWKKQKINMAWG